MTWFYPLPKPYPCGCQLFVLCPEHRAFVDSQRRIIGPTRDAKPPMDARMKVHYSSETQDWATPQAFFDDLNAEFGFTLDACATAENAKCERFFTPEVDGLRQEWRGDDWR